MSIVCSTSNLNNIDKSTPTNYQLIFPKIPTESNIGANNPFVMNIHSAIVPSVSLAVEEIRWQGTRANYAMSPLEFDPWLVSFVVDSNLANWNLLRKWMQFINNNNNKIAEYHKEYSVDAAMVITGNYGNMVKEIIFVDIWPMQLAEISFSQREGDVVLESTINFQYDYFYVRDTEWSEEFSSSSQSSSSKSFDSSSSESSSSESSSSSLSSSSSSLSNSSSSESSNPDLLAGLYIEVGSGSPGHTESLNNAPLLIDNNVCDAAIPSASDRSLSTTSQAFGFGFQGASENIFGFDITCHVSGSATPPYDFIDPHGVYKVTSWYSNNNLNWNAASFNYGSTSFPWADSYDLLAIVRSKQETVKFRIPYTNLNAGSLPTAKYFKFMNLKSLVVSGANKELGELIITEIAPMEGTCSLDGWLISQYPERFQVTNNFRTVRSINSNSSFNQYSRWINPPGKYYWEVLCNGATPPNFHMGFKSGLLDNSTTIYDIENSSGTYSVNGSAAGSYSDGDVLQFAVDNVNGKWWSGKNGTWLNSGNPSAGTNPVRSDVRFGNISVGFLIDSNNPTTFTSQFKESQMAYDIPQGFQAPVVENYDDGLQSCSSSSSSVSSNAPA